MPHGPRFAGAIACLVSLMLGGCAGPMAGAFMVASLASTAATGKGLSEHALSAATDKDCNILESLLRKDRQLCEEPGSPATKNDFKGLLGGEDEPAPLPRPPILTTINGKRVYTMAPISRPQDRRMASPRPDRAQRPRSR